MTKDTLPSPDERCPECGCHTHARVDERKPDGSFGPSTQVRCVNCKCVWVSPGLPSPVSVPEGDARRWPMPGDQMRFLNENGYDGELVAARKIFKTDRTYAVMNCDVGGWSHSIQFWGVPGRWNGVMFSLSSPEEG